MLVALLVSLVVIFVTLMVRVLYDTVSCYWLTPRRIRKMMARQGVTGPSPRPLTGNIVEIASMVSRSLANDCDSIHHDIVDRLLPHYVAWSKQYGKRFIVWNGTEPRLVLAETEMIKELLTRHNATTGKSWLQQQGAKSFIGRGLLMANGDDWHHQRHLTAPAFSGDRLKGYAGHMVECTRRMNERMRKEVGAGGGEIEIGEELHRLTADIISKTMFGSSYDKGKQIFQLLYTLQRLCAQATRHFYFPGSRFFPSKYNREIKSQKREVEGLLMEIIQSRRDCVEIGRSSSYGNDLLGLLLDDMHKNKSKNHLNLQLIMDECKTFFFAGHETTALLLTWTAMLLAGNPTWQDKVRDEVRQVCGPDGVPSVDHLPKLTTLNVVINESLRLYPPATLLPRMAFEDIKLGDLIIPKGLAIWIPVLAIHHSEELWGKDANEFNPERFMTKTFAPGRHFLPFAAGPRNCIGQTYAMMEAKIILAMLISKFSFTISENYRHAPVVVLTIKPKHGVQVILKPLDS
ncbi:PREDICTED: cytokinin hydroxylase [Tarenaya hassleriana]|uniref:cytokinin hydroxylase n=1 Tax=Tarenaya hassleriana TaxID=28532 RepID=UPI00053C2F0A|nr:PREDICTED: cytokinin hydroxylase [Tarenaya hassleriana]